MYIDLYLSQKNLASSELNQLAIVSLNIAMKIEEIDLKRFKKILETA